MNKKWYKRIPLLIMMSMLAVAGCGKNETQSASESTAAAMQKEQKPSEKESAVEIPNPIKELNAIEFAEATDCAPVLPENAENPVYLLIHEELGEVRYTTDQGNQTVIFRVQKTDAFTDISGMYYDWTDVTEETWADFACKRFMYHSEEEGDIQMCLWYNSADQIMYSLSVQAGELNGFDILSAARSIISPDLPMEGYPSNELEARVGKTEFESYDEIIGLLESKEAYALVKVRGYEGEVLLVASDAYDNGDGENMAAVEATPYTKKARGMVTADSLLFTQGTAYPIAIDDSGLIYCSQNRSVDELCYGENGTADVGLMNMKSISVTEFNDEGEPIEVSGFYRDPSKNTVIDYEPISYAENDIEAYYAALDEMANAHVVNFTTMDGRKAACK